VNINKTFSAPDHALFIGIFEAYTIILYPRLAPPFAHYWRHEPNPRELITADSRGLLNMKDFSIPDDKIIVV
jgi:hypothetical protein